MIRMLNLFLFSSRMLRKIVLIISFYNIVIYNKFYCFHFLCLRGVGEWFSLSLSIIKKTLTHRLNLYV